MAIALPLIVDLFRSLDRAVQWLSGGSALPDHSGRDGVGSQEECRNPGCGNPEFRNPEFRNYEFRNSDGPNSGAVKRLCLPRKAPPAADRQWQGPVGPLHLHPARRGWRATPHIAR